MLAFTGRPFTDLTGWVTCTNKLDDSIKGSTSPDRNYRVLPRFRFRLGARASKPRLIAAQFWESLVDRKSDQLECDCLVEFRDLLPLDVVIHKDSRTVSSLWNLGEVSSVNSSDRR
jgi:hypothetical protein